MQNRSNLIGDYKRLITFGRSAPMGASENIHKGEENMIYVNEKNGVHTVDFFATIYKDNKGNDVTDVYVDNCHMHTLRVYYRPERTWDDHMGNTPSGYYCNVPINGKPRRIYYERNGFY